MQLSFPLVLLALTASSSVSALPLQVSQEDALAKRFSWNYSSFVNAGPPQTDDLLEVSKSSPEVPASALPKRAWNYLSFINAGPPKTDDFLKVSKSSPEVPASALSKRAWNFYNFINDEAPDSGDVPEIPNELGAVEREVPASALSKRAWNYYNFINDEAPDSGDLPEFPEELGAVERELAKRFYFNRLDFVNKGAAWKPERPANPPPTNQDTVEGAIAERSPLESGSSDFQH